jgi:rare lipoprotein A
MAPLNLRSALTSCCIFGQLLFAVHTLPLQAEEIGAASTTQGPAAQQAREKEGVEGLASYYAKRYNGRRTNSGHRYDPTKLTAAHPTFPHGTRVRVINLTNDKEVTVTINDRCKSRKHPFIDLSRAAAKQLGFLGKGLARVRIIPLEEELT